MNWNIFVREVARLSKEVAFDDLQQALIAAAETDEECEQADEDPHEVLHSEAPFSSLIGFVWYGAYADRLCLELLDGGDCGLIVVRDFNEEPGSDFAVLATVESPRSPGVLAAALGRVPRSVFVNECTSEPDEITNCVPDLLPRSAIQEWYCGSNESSMAHFARAYSEAGSQ